VNFPPEIAASVEEAWPARAMLGEGPVWDSATGRLVWVDIKGRRIHAFSHADGARESWEPPCRFGSLVRPAAGWRPPADLGGDVWLGCGDGGLVWLGLAPGAVEMRTIARPERDRPGYRFNDGKMGPDGRYWAGVMDDAEEEAEGRLYAFSPDGTWAVVDAGYAVPNGPAFSPDGRTLYHTDSARRRVYAFDLSETGEPGPRRLLREFGEGDGYPDGMTVDDEGTIWIAMWDGACLRRLAPDGSDVGRVSMPTPRCTSCAFAAPGVIYVTSAAIGLDGAPGAGSLYRVRLA